MNANRKNDTLTVLQRLKEHPEALHAARVVGRWVWIEFAEKPAAEIRDFLKVEGFNWNHTRKAWQHSCGVFRPSAPYDPRWKYGEVRAEELITA